MKKHNTCSRTGLGLLFSGALLLAALTPSLHSQVNAVYVESNIATFGQNSILGFSNDGFGNMTPLPGSPYLTDGTGWAPPNGQPLGFQQDDDQQIVINKAGTQLFAVNGHSNTVVSFGINDDGSLSMIGSPVSSAGTQPASLGLFDGALSNGSSLLAVVNKSSDPSQPNPKAPNIVTFTVDPGGVLKANVGSKVTLASGSSPSQAAVGNSKLVFVDEFLASPSQLASYRIHSNGMLQFNGAVTAPPGTSLFLGEVVSPTGNYLYVALPVESKIAVYHYSVTSGLLSLVSTVSTPGLLPCWLTINAAGTHLYSADTQSGTISVFDVSNPQQPAFRQQIQLSTQVGNGQPWNVQIDPSGQFLYAVTGIGLHAMNILSDGTLAELASPTLLPVPANTYPYGLAAVQK